MGLEHIRAQKQTYRRERTRKREEGGGGRKRERKREKGDKEMDGEAQRCIKIEIETWRQD